MKSGIYQILNVVNGKIYVGSSINIKGRWSSHRKELKQNKHKNIHLQYAYNKYGVDAFEYFVIEYCPQQELIAKEQAWMDAGRVCERGQGYNMKPTAGSPLGSRHSEETKRKMSESRRGENNHNYGKTYSAERRRRMSDARKGIPSPNKGRKYKPHTPEAKRKIAEAGRGRVPSVQTRQKMAEARKKYITFDGRTLCISDWAQELGITRSALSHRLKVRPLEEALDPNMERFTAAVRKKIAESLASTRLKQPCAHSITFNGKTQGIREWSDETGILYDTLAARLGRLGWSIERALTAPVMRKAQVSSRALVSPCTGEVTDE